MLILLVTYVLNIQFIMTGSSSHCLLECLALCCRLLLLFNYQLEISFFWPLQGCLIKKMSISFKYILWQNILTILKLPDTRTEQYMFMLSLAGHALQKDTSLIGIFLLLTRNFLFFRYCLNKQLELARNGQKNGYIVIVPTKKIIRRGNNLMNAQIHTKLLPYISSFFFFLSTYLLFVSIKWKRP